MSATTIEVVPGQKAEVNLELVKTIPAPPLPRPSPALEPAPKPLEPSPPAEPVRAVPKTGSIRITSEPAGARIVRPDDTDTGKRTPALFEELASGKWAFRLELDGYEAANGSATIVPGRIRTVRKKLVPAAAAGGKDTLVQVPRSQPPAPAPDVPSATSAPQAGAGSDESLPIGGLAIGSVPEGAHILGPTGTDTGKVTPSVVRDLPPGNWQFSLALGGFQTLATRALVEAGKVRIVTRRLVKADGARQEALARSGQTEGPSDGAAEAPASREVILGNGGPGRVEVWVYQKTIFAGGTVRPGQANVVEPVRCELASAGDKSFDGKTYHSYTNTMELRPGTYSVRAVWQWQGLGGGSEHVASWPDVRVASGKTVTLSAFGKYKKGLFNMRTGDYTDVRSPVYQP